MANRVVWSLIFCALLITVTRAWRVLGAALRNRAILGTLALAAGLIAVNWLTYTYGVTTGQAVEASLGYFINPLVSVLLGVFVLKETLRPLQWAAVGIGFIAVGVLTVSYGKLPWIALTLAVSFGLYGFVKKRVGPRADAVTSLTVETIVLAPLAAATMIFLAASGTASLTTHGPGHFWLLLASGVITAVPLVFFGASARRLPMTTIGLLQYFAPVLQFIVALVVFREAMTLERWIGFGVVWLALLVLTVDMLAATRKSSAGQAPRPQGSSNGHLSPRGGATTVRSRSKGQHRLGGRVLAVVVARHNHHGNRQGPQHLVGRAAQEHAVLLGQA